MPPNARILDFSCGIGRHSIPLSTKGYQVVGFDPSSFYLKIARQQARSLCSDTSHLPKFIEGNPYDASRILMEKKEMDFEAIIIMDNSLGYNEESYDIIMLKELSKLAKKDCVLIMETENRDWRLKHFEPLTSFCSEKVEIYSSWKFNFDTSISHGIAKFYEKNNSNDKNLHLSLKLDMYMRLYAIHELRNLVNESGWKFIESYDDIISLTPFSNGNVSIFSVSVRK